MVAQFFLAGYGAFATVNDKKFDEDNFGPHALLGDGLMLLALILLLLALIGRWSRDARNWSGLLFGLMVIQSFLGALGADTSAWFGALHALNALLILACTGMVIRQARGYSSPRAAGATEPEAPTAIEPG